MRFTKKLIALILLTLTVSWQAQAARTWICGFEANSKGEGNSATTAGNVCAVVNTTVRSGVYALLAQAGTAGCAFNLSSTDSAGALRPLFQSVRFYIQVGSLPDSSYRLAFTSTPTLQDWIALNADGTLSIGHAGPVTDATSVNALSADATWHRIEFDCGWSSGNGRRVYVDGISWASVSTTASSARTGGAVGLTSTTTGSIFIDDVLWDDASFATSGLPGDGNVLLLRPTSDPVSLNSWTGGAGGTTNLWDAVNGRTGAPVGSPEGVAPASATNTSQIKNAASGTTLDYLPSVTSYTTAGIGAGSTINAVMAIGNDCEEVTTGTKVGGFWIGSNPTQSAPGNTFNYGNDTATVCGTYPAGWAWHVGPVAVGPSVTLGTQPTVGVRKGTASTRVTDADFLGIYVDYTPAASGCSRSIALMGVGCR